MGGTLRPLLENIATDPVTSLAVMPLHLGYLRLSVKLI